MAEPEVTEQLPTEAEPTNAEPIQASEPDNQEVQGTESDTDGLGGTAPEAVRARKEYRRRKDLEDEREHLVIAKAQAEERARLLEERLKEKPAVEKPVERIFSKVELRQAVIAGQISQDQADEYEEKILIPHRVQETLHQERERERQHEPLNRARTDIQDYFAVAPELRDRNSQVFTNVAQTYRYLVENYGMPENEVTQALAIQHSMGPIDKLKAKAQTATLTRRNIPQSGMETVANGVAPRSNVIDLSKAPDHMQRMWSRTNTASADREKEFRYWQESQKRA